MSNNEMHEYFHFLEYGSIKLSPEENSYKLSPKEYGYFSVRWAHEFSVEIIEQLFARDDADKNKYIVTIQSKSKLFQVLFMSLRVAAYFTFVNIQQPRKSVISDVVFGVIDGFREFDNGEFENTFHQLFKFFKGKFEDDMSLPPLNEGELRFDESVKGFFEVFEKFYSVDAWEWEDEIITRLELSQIISRCGVGLIRRDLPKMFKFVSHLDNDLNYYAPTLPMRFASNTRDNDKGIDNDVLGLSAYDGEPPF